MPKDAVSGCIGYTPGPAHIASVIIHSVEDGYIPFSQAERLYAAANDPKKFIKTTGSHLDLFDQNDNYLSKLLEYLDQLE